MSKLRMHVFEYGPTSVRAPECYNTVIHGPAPVESSETIFDKLHQERHKYTSMKHDIAYKSLKEKYDGLLKEYRNVEEDISRQRDSVKRVKRDTRDCKNDLRSISKSKKNIRAEYNQIKLERRRVWNTANYFMVSQQEVDNILCKIIKTIVSYDFEELPEYVATVLGAIGRRIQEFRRENSNSKLRSSHPLKIKFNPCCPKTHPFAYIYDSTYQDPDIKCL